jgi:hypothetical protein
MNITIKVPAGVAEGITAKVRNRVERAGKRALPKIAAFITDHISAEVDRQLHRTAVTYKAGLAMPGSVVQEDLKITVKLPEEATAARALEEGFDAFDMKGPLLKRAKGGKSYVDVPFRHGASPSSRNFPGMPADVKKKMDSAADATKAAVMVAGGTKEQAALTRTRLKMTTKGKSFAKDLLFGGHTVKLRGKHKQGIHDDMLKIPKRAGKRITSTYSTYRRVSENSDPTAWWHPGFRGVKAFAKTATVLKANATKIFHDELKKSGLL